MQTPCCIAVIYWQIVYRYEIKPQKQDPMIRRTKKIKIHVIMDGLES